MNHADCTPALFKATVAKLEAGATAATGAAIKSGVVPQGTALPYVHLEVAPGNSGDRTTTHRSQVITIEIAVYSDKDSPSECLAIMGAIRADLGPLLDLSSYGSFAHTGYDEPQQDGPNLEDGPNGARQVGRFLQPQWVLAT